jgi:hypothetical protein
MARVLHEEYDETSVDSTAISLIRFRRLAEYSLYIQPFHSTKPVGSCRYYPSIQHLSPRHFWIQLESIIELFSVNLLVLEEELFQVEPPNPNNAVKGQYVRGTPIFQNLLTASKLIDGYDEPLARQAAADHQSPLP